MQIIKYKIKFDYNQSELNKFFGADTWINTLLNILYNTNDRCYLYLHFFG